MKVRLCGKRFLLYNTDIYLSTSLFRIKKLPGRHATQMPTHRAVRVTKNTEEDEEKNNDKQAPTIAFAVIREDSESMTNISHW